MLGLGLGLPGAAVMRGGPPAKTYADFQSHIRSKATNGFVAWATNVGVGNSKFWTTAGTVGGTMAGSTWNDKTDSSFAPCRAVQHAMKNQTIFDEQVASGFDIYFETADGGFVGVLNSVTRNGYTSVGASSGPYASRVMPLLIRWDDTLKKAFQSNPSVAGAETEYVF